MPSTTAPHCRPCNTYGGMGYPAGAAPVRRIYIRKPGGKGYEPYGWTCIATDHVRVDVLKFEEPPGKERRCRMNADLEATWPGLEAEKICRDHLAPLQHLAAALNVVLQLEHVGYGGHLCQTRIDRIELDMPVSITGSAAFP